VKYGTVKSLSETIGIGAVLLMGCIKESGVQPMQGRDMHGVRRNYFPEPTVLAACAYHLRPMPQADESGSFVLDGIRYRTIKGWVRELGIAEASILSRLCSASVHPVEARDSGKRIFDFYPESAIHSTCADLFCSLPQTDESGFFVFESVRYGTIRAWSHEFKVTSKVVANRIGKRTLQPKKGKSRGGQVHDFYPEPVIRDLMSDYLRERPVCDSAGVALANGVRYATASALSKSLGIPSSTIRLRLSQSELQPIHGKYPKINVAVNLFSETRVRELVSDLLVPFPQSDENGLVVVSGVSYGTILSLARFLGVSTPTVRDRLDETQIESIKGKNGNGQVCDFYPIPAVRELCKDLIEKKKSNPKPR